MNNYKFQCVLSCLITLQACTIIAEKKKVLTYDDNSSKLDCIKTALSKTPKVTIVEEQIWGPEEKYYDKDLLKFETEESIKYAIVGSKYYHAVGARYYPGRKREVYNSATTSCGGPIPAEIQSVIDEVTTNIKKFCGVPVSEEQTGRLK